MEVEMLSLLASAPFQAVQGSDFLPLLWHEPVTECFLVLISQYVSWRQGRANIM